MWRLLALGLVAWAGSGGNWAPQELGPVVQVGLHNMWCFCALGLVTRVGLGEAKLQARAAGSAGAAWIGSSQGWKPGDWLMLISSTRPQGRGLVGLARPGEAGWAGRFATSTQPSKGAAGVAGQRGRWELSQEGRDPLSSRTWGRSFWTAMRLGWGPGRRLRQRGKYPRSAPEIVR